MADFGTPARSPFWGRYPMPRGRGVLTPSLLMNRDAKQIAPNLGPHENVRGRIGAGEDVIRRAFDHGSLARGATGFGERLTLLAQRSHPCFAGIRVIQK